jgi:hypothetical protein
MTPDLRVIFLSIISYWISVSECIWVSILAKRPSTWRFAIQGHSFLTKTRYSALHDVNQTNFARTNDHLLICIDCHFAICCVNHGHSLRERSSSDDLIVGFCRDRLKSSILLVVNVNRQQRPLILALPYQNPIKRPSIASQFSPCQGWQTTVFRNLTVAEFMSVHRRMRAVPVMNHVHLRQ